MLEVRSLEVRFGEVRVLAGVDLRVGAGEIVALIGPNGAGKTTLLKTISGLVKPVRGLITFAGIPLIGLTADAITARGIAHVPEGRRIFPQLTVEENLKVGGHLVRGNRQLRLRLADVYRLFPRLYERRRQSGQTLSGGEQQMLALGRAMVSRPQLLLLDEPSLGLAPLILVEVARAVPLLQQQGASILLVEQNAKSRACAMQSRLCDGSRPDRSNRHRGEPAQQPKDHRELSGRRCSKQRTSCQNDDVQFDSIALAK